MSARQDSSQASTESDFYIVGRRKLQNETIASCLERETGNECFVLEDISQIPPVDPKDLGRQRLVLLDCQGKNSENVLAELRLHLKQKQSTNHVVLFSVGRNLGIEKKCVLEGIRGFFYETDPLDRFLKGLRAVLKGELWLSREIMTKCILEGTDRPSSSRSDSEPLTPRQVQILAQVAIGGTNDEIAETLYLSPHTVRTHLHNIFKKINVPNRTQAALWAAKNL